MATNESLYRQADIIGAYRVTSAAELPNVSGATLQTAALSIGNFAFAGARLYRCTLATLGAATWELVDNFADPINSSVGDGLSVGFFIATAAGTIFAQSWDGRDISVANGVHAETGSFAYTLSGTDVPTTFGVQVQTIDVKAVCPIAYKSGAGTLALSIVAPGGAMAAVASNETVAALTRGLTLAEYTPGSGQYDFTVTGCGTAFVPVAVMNTSTADRAISCAVTGAPAAGVRVLTTVASTAAAVDLDFYLHVLPVASAGMAYDALHMVTIVRF